MDISGLNSAQHQDRLCLINETASEVSILNCSSSFPCLSLDKCNLKIIFLMSALTRGRDNDDFASVKTVGNLLCPDVSDTAPK